MALHKKKVRSIPDNQGVKLVEATAKHPEKQDDLFPQWLTERKDFQACFPRFTPSSVAISDDDQLRFAIMKAPISRSESEIQLLAKWVLRFPTLHSLSQKHAVEIAHVSKYVCLSPGEFVFHQGDVGDACYMCVSGEINVIMNGLKVTTIGKGAAFGDVALETQGRKRTASIQAYDEGDVELLQIRADDYKKILSRFHTQRRKNLMKWLRKEVKLITDFSEHKLKYFESVSVDVTFKAGDVLYSEGDVVGPIYFIKCGTVRLEKTNLSEKRHRRPSSVSNWAIQVHKQAKQVQISLEQSRDFFGMEGLMKVGSRSHTAIAETNLHLVAVNKIDCTSYLFNGKALEDIKEKYRKLEEFQSVQTYAHVDDLVRKHNNRRSSIAHDESKPPIYVVQKYRESLEKTDYQFPYLTTGKTSEINEVVKATQLKISLSNFPHLTC